MEEFIKNFANQWDETEPEVFTKDCVFHELEEWSSLTGLAILNMVGKKYGVRIAPDELKACVTIEDLYKLIQNKK